MREDKEDLDDKDCGGRGKMRVLFRGEVGIVTGKKSPKSSSGKGILISGRPGEEPRMVS